MQPSQGPSNPASESDMVDPGLLLDVTLDALSTVSWALGPAGVVLILIAMGMMFRTARMGSYIATFSHAMQPLVLGVGLLVVSFLVSSRQQGDAQADPSPSPSPIPSPDTSSTSSPTPRPPADPIVLPEVQNLEFLWVVPLAIISIAGLYLLVRKVSADAAAQKTDKAEASRVAALIAARWESVRAQHRELEQGFLKAETDWDMLFNYPELQDSSVPQTASMVRAMMKAASMEQSQPSTLTETSDLDRYPYPQAVSAFEHAWYIAYEHAKKVGQSRIPSEERRLIKQIRQILELAENSGATQSERDLAYSRVSKLIKALKSVRIPPKVLQELESGRQLMLES